MATLYFNNPTFKTGRNITCRRGIKWDVADKESVYIVDINDSLLEDGQLKILDVVNIETRVFRFCDLIDSDIQDEHDTGCRTIQGLLKDMKQIYPGFDEREIITLVSFFIICGDNE